MTIKITWKAVAMVAAGVATVAAAYWLAKKEEEQREKIKKHKEEKLDGRDLEQEMNEASVHNDKLESDERAAAYEVLEDKYLAVKNAYYTWDFDKALEDFDRAKGCITQEDDEAALAALLIYKDRLKRKRKAAETAREIERDRERNKTELEKASTIAKAIKSIANNPSDLDNLFKQASSISITTRR
jgi:hypothetical protein